jgi:TetR/AcrR family transcriptional regulator
VSLRAIGQEADVDSALIVRRYDGKLGLWRAVVDHVSNRLKQAGMSDATADLPTAVLLERAIARFVRLSLAMPDLGRFFVDEIAKPGERRDYVLARIWDVHRSAMLPIIEAAAREGLIPRGCSPDAYMAMLIGAVAMPLMMRSVALPSLDHDGGGEEFLRNVTALFASGNTPCSTANSLHLDEKS